MSCYKFEKVSHVTHRFRVEEILRVGKLAGRIVYDDSTLNETRTHVVWLSPNTWAYGSRYGSVSIDFDWASLTRSRHPYWVEVAQYKPHACRILLTKNELNLKEHPNLKSYDPTLRKGPWWYDTKSDTHYYNSDYVLEFMIEGDLPLSKVLETTFTRHNPSMCSEYPKSPSSCQYLDRSEQTAAARLVATLVAGGKASERLKISRTTIQDAWRDLANRIVTSDVAGPVSADDSVARSLALSILYMLGEGKSRKKEAQDLVDLFASDADVEKAVRHAVEDALGLDPEDLADD